MLQQTRVEAVVPYYRRWLERFPSVTALAEARLDDVLKAWEGLGYYARARNLHRAARVVRERHAGTLPADLAALRALPGVGDYTAGAVASIAFGIPSPAVDGNTRRVLCRLFDLSDPTSAELKRLAHRLVPKHRPGDFNQALMELGATLCTPAAPACASCPLAACCRARARGTELERPRRKRRGATPEVAVGTAVVIDRARRVLLVRRPEQGLLGGLWELPGEEVRNGEAAAAAARRAARAALAASHNRNRSAGPRLGRASALGVVRHTFTHRRMTYQPFRFRVRGPDAGPVAIWATERTLQDLALPAAHRRILRLVHS